MSCISQARPGYASVTNNPQKPNITKILTYAACAAREGSAHCNHSWTQPTEARMTSQWEPLEPLLWQEECVAGSLTLTLNVM